MENRKELSKNPGGEGRGAMELDALLFALGVTSNYKGFHQTVAAVALAAERPEDLLLVTKTVYPVVARRCHTSWRAVERNIRLVAEQAWAHRPDLLSQLAGRELTERPTAREFIAILVGGYGWVRSDKARAAPNP